MARTASPRKWNAVENTAYLSFVIGQNSLQRLGLVACIQGRGVQGAEGGRWEEIWEETHFHFLQRPPLSSPRLVSSAWEGETVFPCDE